MIRKAKTADIDSVAKIYDKIHDEEEKGLLTTGWKRGIYPTVKTANAAIERDDLFVLEENGQILGAAIFNKQQVDVYEKGNWRYKGQDSEIMVMHTLVIAPDYSNMGYGRIFEQYYEDYARQNNCSILRIDTNEKNSRARAFYKALGYLEAGCVPCVFNGLENVPLVLLEKELS